MNDDSDLFGIGRKEQSPSPSPGYPSNANVAKALEVADKLGYIKDGWETARDIASWMDGKSRERALIHIDRMETLYRESSQEDDKSYEGIPCTCKQRHCIADPCKGGCGCNACSSAYGDQLDSGDY